MTDYERETYSLLNDRMPEHATVEALLAIAYELRTAFGHLVTTRSRCPDHSRKAWASTSARNSS